MASVVDYTQTAGYLRSLIEQWGDAEWAHIKNLPQDKYDKLIEAIEQQVAKGKMRSSDLIAIENFRNTGEAYPREPWVAKGQEFAQSVADHSGIGVIGENMPSLSGLYDWKGPVGETLGFPSTREMVEAVTPPTGTITPDKIENVSRSRYYDMAYPGSPGNAEFAAELAKGNPIAAQVQTELEAELKLQAEQDAMVGRDIPPSAKFGQFDYQGSTEEGAAAGAAMLSGGYDPIQAAETIGKHYPAGGRADTGEYFAPLGPWSEWDRVAASQVGPTGVTINSQAPASIMGDQHPDNIGPIPAAEETITWNTPRQEPKTQEPKDTSFMGMFDDPLARKAWTRFGLDLASRPTHGVGGMLQSIAAAGANTQDYYDKLVEKEAARNAAVAKAKSASIKALAEISKLRAEAKDAGLTGNIKETKQAIAWLESDNPADKLKGALLVKSMGTGSDMGIDDWSKAAADMAFVEPETASRMIEILKVDLTAKEQALGLGEKPAEPMSKFGVQGKVITRHPK